MKLETENCESEKPIVETGYRVLLEFFKEFPNCVVFFLEHAKLFVCANEPGWVIWDGISDF